MLQQSQMQSFVLPADADVASATIHTLARDSGLAWKTTRLILEGQGTVTSLDRLRRTLNLKWSWTSDEVGAAPGAALASRRQAKGLSQRAMAAKLAVSPQTIVTLETRFTGRVETLRRYLRVLRINDVLSTKAKRLVPGRNEAKADVVYTPRALAQRIIGLFSAEFRGQVLDPARGDGAFYDALPDHLDKFWCEVDEGRNFYDWTAPMDWIITNPPWSEFREFLQHSLRIADNILYLAPLNHYTTKRRVAMIGEAGFGVRQIVMVPTPTGWPSSGFQLAAVWLQRSWKGSAEFSALQEEGGTSSA